MSVVTLEYADNVAIITVDNPPVNVLSSAVRQGLQSALATIASDDKVEAAVLVCAGRTFIAGADIKEFSMTNVSGPSLPELIPEIEASPVPIVAAMHGTALGGGFEVAMACQYRIALASAQVGLPEVKLGIIPGAGGTQLLPRLIGLEAATGMILNCNRLKAPKALELGAVDKVVEDNLQDEAVAFARTLIGKAHTATSAHTVDGGADAQAFLEKTRQMLAKKMRGFLAPLAALKAVEASMTSNLADGMKFERECFMECKNSPQSTALQHMFFAERMAKNIPDLPRDLAERPVESVGIIGAGTMGGGIAMSFASAGIEVTILDMSEEALDRGLATVKTNYDRTAKRGILTPEQVEQCLGRISGTLDYDDLADCDLIIEAAVEKMDIKEIIFKKLDETVKAGAILASNTSYLDINHLASVTKRPEDVLGLHFFSPANIMKLLEIVRGSKTAPDVMATVLTLAKRIGKIGVVSGVCHGFIGNRMLSCYGREANLAVMAGASPSQVDKALYNFGMAMGPLSVSDMAGLDIGYFNRKALAEESYEKTAYGWVNRLVELERKGIKTGAGIYRYEAGNRTPIPDPLVDEIIEEEAKAAGISRGPITDEAIVERCILTLINEGAKILEEGIALRASDIDLVYCNGYGFPALRGGPMHYADHLGLAHVCERIRHLQENRGERWWKLSPLLIELAVEGRSFAEYDKAR